MKHKMTTADVLLFAVAWLLGGTSGALRSFRSGEHVALREIVSSGLLSGMISLMCVAYFFDRGLTTPMAVCISIAAGITADDLVRVVVAGVKGAVARIIGDAGKR